MNKDEIAITASSLGKRYRIGQKEEMSDSIGSSVWNALKSPLRNYRKYRSLYKFDDIKGEQKDIIWAVKDISFDIKKGELVGIIGRNGAGKSTLLKILCRITSPSTGKAEIHGRVSSLLEVGTGFHPELTGRENIFLNGTILGMTKKEVDQKYDEIVEFSGVRKFINTPVKRYSSGMTVRLAFSVAAHLEPEILIVDEVLAVGDSDFQKKCINKMEGIGQQGRTVIFVSHNMNAITRLCNRAILIEDGRVVDDGMSTQVVRNYLTAGTGMTARRSWNDKQKAPSSSNVRLNSVTIKRGTGEISDTIDIKEEIRLEMQYDVTENGYVFLPHFSIYNEHGQCVFITVDVDPDWRRKNRPMGNYTSRVTIPGNFLSEGLFFVHCFILTLNPDCLQIGERNAICFQVFDDLEGESARGDYSQGMLGVVRPLLKWKTRFVPENNKLVIKHS